MSDRRGFDVPRRGPGRPVSADSTHTKAKIVRAGRQVVNERGYAATTFQEIARRAGLSRPTLNYYFPNRDALYEALVTESHDVVNGCIDVANQHSSPTRRLRTFMLGLLDVACREPSLAAFLANERLEAHRNPVLPTGGALATATFLTGTIGDAVAARELPAHVESTALAELLHGIIWGVGAWVGSPGATADLPSVARQLEIVLDAGLLSDGGRPV